MVRWIRYLPADLDPSRIDLQINLAWALAHRFRFQDARQLLDALETLAAASGEALAHSSWVKLRVVRAICEAFAENIPQSIAIVEPLLRRCPAATCGSMAWCATFSATAIWPTPGRSRRSTFSSGYRARVRPAATCSSACIGLSSWPRATCARAIWWRPSVRPAGRWRLRNGRPAPAPAAARRWRRSSPKSPGSRGDAAH